MASSFANFALFGTLTIAAVPDRILRVRRILLTASQNVYAQALSDPAGTATPIGPELSVQNAGCSILDCDFSAQPLNGERGASVGITTSATNPHSVWVEYDVVE